MLRSKSSFNWTYSMAKSSDFPAFLMYLFHNFTNNSYRIDLFEDGIDFYEANALYYIQAIH
jgi:hypothetical protein